MRIRFSVISVAVMVWIAVADGVTPAHADLKVVTESKISGLPDPGQTMPAAAGLGTPATTTAYYKGDRSRLEAPGGNVTIVTGAAGGGKTYLLDTVRRTYTLVMPPDSVGAPNAAAASILSSLHVEGEVNVDPDNSAKKDIAGHAAAQRRYSANFKVYLGGGDAGSGGVPGLLLATAVVKGEQWTTDTLVPPPAFAEIPATASLMGAISIMSKGGSKITEKLSKIKGFPLLSIVTVKIEAPKDSPFAEAIAGAIPSGDIVARTEVKSVSEDPLSDDLFTIPAGYSLIVSAAAPAMPAAPGAGGTIPPAPSAAH